MKQPLLTPDASYTFSDFFRLDADREDILAYFGYSFQIQNCHLPRVTLQAEEFSDLNRYLEQILSYLSLTSEMARREFLIAPIVSKVALYTQTKIKVEWALKVNNQLKGVLDYYLQGKKNLLIVEAKHSDPERGFTQLAVELIALDHWLEDDSERLYGAVSMGNIWNFGVLDRRAKQVTQDINWYGVPTHFTDLMSILVAILRG